MARRSSTSIDPARSTPAPAETVAETEVETFQPQRGGHSGNPGAGTPGPSADQISAVLLEVLTKLNQRTNAPPQLTDAALRVALNYRQIAVELLTLADSAPTAFPPAPPASGTRNPSA